MKLFDEFIRTDSSPKLNSENKFEFFNRSASPEVMLARDRLEIFVSVYPCKNELISRFRSGNDVHFSSASFELLLFTCLSAFGYELEPHPILSNGSEKMPDFLITSPNGESFYLECVIAKERSEDSSNHPLIQTTLDVFNKNSHPNFYLSVRTEGIPDTQPSGKVLLNATNKWLDSLNPDELSDAWMNQPEFCWSHENFSVHLMAIPIEKRLRGSSQRMLGVQEGRAGWINSSIAIRKAIMKKGGRYGELDRPFIIAVNMIDSFTEDIDEVDALFGDEVIVIPVGGDDTQVRKERKPNGAWMDESGPRYTRVVGAWIFRELEVFNLHSVDSTLYINPWATYTLPELLKQFSHCVIEDSQIIRKKGYSITDSMLCRR